METKMIIIITSIVIAIAILVFCLWWFLWRSESGPDHFTVEPEYEHDGKSITNTIFDGLTDAAFDDLLSLNIVFDKPEAGLFLDDIIHYKNDGKWEEWAIADATKDVDLFVGTGNYKIIVRYTKSTTSNNTTINGKLLAFDGSTPKLNLADCVGQFPTDSFKDSKTFGLKINVLNGTKGTSDLSYEPFVGAGIDTPQVVIPKTADDQDKDQHIKYDIEMNDAV
jgi:hypothetical protein